MTEEDVLWLLDSAAASNGGKYPDAVYFSASDYGALRRMVREADPAYDPSVPPKISVSGLKARNTWLRQLPYGVSVLPSTAMCENGSVKWLVSVKIGDERRF